MPVYFSKENKIQADKIKITKNVTIDFLEYQFCRSLLIFVIESIDNIPLSEIQLKLIYGKNSDISPFTHSLLIPEEIDLKKYISYRDL